jgi:hypothetical protein
MSGSVRRWMGVGRRKPFLLMARSSQGLSPIDSSAAAAGVGEGHGGARRGWGAAGLLPLLLPLLLPPLLLLPLLLPPLLPPPP